MHRVSRLNKPQSLEDNAEYWTKELLNQITIKGNYAKVEDKYKVRYKSSDIIETLKDMYSNLCCFCESYLGLQTYERIEHLKPKSKFPELSFEWSNLNLVCEICNTSYKRDNWSSIYPFLDPSSEDISQFLKLNLITGEYDPVNNNLRAKYTIEYTGINREQLVEKRKDIINYCMKLVFEVDKEQFIENISNLKCILGYPTTYNTIIEELNNNSQSDKH